MSRQLRAVDVNDTPPRKSSTVSSAITEGSERDLLAALRTRIAKAIDDSKTLPRDLAALTRRLQEVDKDIRAMDAAENGDDIGDAASTPDEDWAAV